MLKADGQNYPRTTRDYLTRLRLPVIDAIAPVGRKVAHTGDEGLAPVATGSGTPTAPPRRRFFWTGQGRLQNFSKSPP